MDFKIPLRTPLSEFYSEDVPDEDKKTRCLGIITHGVKYSPYLSLSPQFSNNIREHITKKKRDKNVKMYMNEVGAWAKAHDISAV